MGGLKNTHIPDPHVLLTTELGDYEVEKPPFEIAFELHRAGMIV